MKNKLFKGKGLKRDKSLLYLVLVVIVYAIIVYLTDVSATSEPDYTVFSTSQKGASLLFDTLKKMEYPVKIGYEQVNEYSNLNDVYVLINPDPMSFSEDDIYEMLDFVDRGGRVIYCEFDEKYLPLDDTYFSEDAIIEEYDNFMLISEGMGEMAYFYTDSLTNQALIDDAISGTNIDGLLDYWGYDNIVFSEYIHGYKQNPSFFAILPLPLKLFVYQLGLIALMIVWLLGKRFGRALPLYEEIEREENEYVKTIATIYKNAGKGEIAVESYYSNFLQTSANYFGVTLTFVKENLVDLWKEKQLPNVEMLISVSQLMQTQPKFNTKIGRKKEFVQTIKNIDTLTLSVQRRF